MSRISTLRRHPKRTLVGLAAVLAAVAVAVGSGADFTSTSSNTTNSFTAGVLHHTNTASGNVFGAGTNLSGIKPGFGMTGSSVNTSTSGDNYGKVVIANDTSGSETLALTKSITSAAGTNTDACGGSCSKLGDALSVRIVKDGVTGTPVFDDVLSKLSASTFDSSVSYAGSASHTYELYFYLPSSAGNEFQGGSASVKLDWSAS